MIIDAVIQVETSTEPGKIDMYIGEIIGWCHQCYQLYELEKTIDLEEFKRRLNVENIDYNQIAIDYADMLADKSATVHIQRVIDILNS